MVLSKQKPVLFTTVRNFVYCESLSNQMVFCKQSCIQYAVKFVNAVLITCNHPKIGMINPGFPLATPLPCPSCPSSHCCATCLMIYLCGWVRSVELVMISIATYVLMPCTDHRHSQAWAAAQASPIIALVSTSYLNF